MRLVLFDVDGTLLLTGGASGRALRSALIQTYGLPNSLEALYHDGKTDPQIVRETLSHHGKAKDFTGKKISSVFSVYLAFLREELIAVDNFQVLPGARELVRTLDQQDSFLLGLATGNIEEGARLKLEPAGLESFFSFGGFGSDAENRTELNRIATERGRQRMAPADLERVFTVGDTPRDIVHGKEAGAHTLAVASGNYSLDDLRSHEPDLAVASLHPIEPILEFLSS